MKESYRQLILRMKALMLQKNNFAFQQLSAFVYDKIANRFIAKRNIALQKAAQSLGNEKFTQSPYFEIDCFKFAPLESSVDRLMFVDEYFEIIPDDKFFNEYNVYSENNKSFFSKIEGSLARWSDGGPYEIEQVQVEPGDIVLDAGANMGIFSLLAAKKGGTVYAFEPQPKVFSTLQKNIELNAATTITPLMLGVGNVNEDVTLYEMPGNHLGASIAIHRSENAQIIKCVTLDEWTKQMQLPRVDFIKADIEGAERLLLDGAHEVLRTHKPKLAICTYHLSDDPFVLSEKIRKANPEYSIVHGKTKLYAW